MPLLCTGDDIAALTKHVFDEEAEDAVEQVIDLVEGELRSYINRPLVPTVVVGERAYVENGIVNLRNTPVVSVQAVRYGGTVTLYTGTKNTIPGGLEFTGLTGVWGDSFDVDYTAGVRQQDSGVLKSVVVARVCRIVAKVHDDAAGVSSLTQEGYNAAYLEEGFTEQELLLVDRQRRRVVV